MMDAPNRSTLWANLFVDELARAGLRYVCIAPGSRSTPLTLAFAACPDITVYSLLDERGAAFFGLGLALATGEPVALLCTSGTATVNFHPAIVEAYYSQVPLLVLTADRPHELRDSGANQTMDQVKLYGDHVRWFVDVAPPEAQPAALTLRYLRTLAGRALATAKGSPAGPVHLNFPFRKPLEPIPVSGDGPAQPDEKTVLALQGRTGSRVFTQISRGLLSPTPDQINTVAQAIQEATRGVIVCGPRCPGGDFVPALTRLARVSGLPILADALSGLRFGPHTEEAGVLVCSGYETFLQREATAGWAAPDLILQIGAMPTSQALNDYLAAQWNCRRIALSDSGVWQDELHTLTDLIWAQPAATCRAVANHLEAASLYPRDETWPAQLRAAEQQTWQTFEAIRAESFFEGAILAEVVELLPAGAWLYVASSLPVRHLDQFVRSRPGALHVLANRGVSGIDGTISSALGAAAAADAPLVLVTGDLAFYHDLNGLLALQRCGLKVTIVLINNDGGGIFHRLPIAKFDPPFTDLFVTPHGLKFEPVVRMFGADYVQTSDRAAFRAAFQEAISAERSYVIEVPSDSVLHEQTRREMIRTVMKQMTT